jgi:signal transduction histidine kinase
MRGEPGSYVELIRRTWESGRWIGDVGYNRPDGHEGTLELTLVVVAVEGDLADQILVVAHDVTEQRLEAQCWMQSEKLKGIGQLAAGVAHEINTPAQYISDNIRFLEDAFRQLVAEGTEGQTGENREYLMREVPLALGQSLEGMGRIADIVRGIKLFAHPGSGERAAIDLNQEIETGVTVSRNEWKYHAELTTDLDPELPPVPGFSGELGHVFLNLIVNAAHAISGETREGVAPAGVIHITSRRDGEWVEVRVADNGPGIPEAVRSKVFDPFFTTKPVGKGTGQGLAICHRVVVEMHGGTIHFESSPGAGTTFVVRLPLNEPRSSADRKAA